LFDCAACPVALAQADLWPENAEAWDLFEAIASRAAVDLQMGGTVLAHALADRDTDDGLILVRRLAVLYDRICPPPAPKA